MAVYDWRREVRIQQAMVLALAGAFFVCGLCIGYLFGIGVPLW